jgi:myo-inositol-1(or 4)-monophosphatase
VTAAPGPRLANGPAPATPAPAAPCSPEESVRLRRIAASAAQAAADHLARVFRGDMHIEHKGDAYDLVTEHDVAAEHIIRNRILAEEPDSTVLGEEGGATGSGRVAWHVDPIDGTVNFARGIAFWCVSVAAAIDGVVVAGAIADPMGGNEFTADLTGVWHNGGPARPRAATEELAATVVSTFPRAVDLGSNGAGAMDASRRLVESFGAVRCLGSGALGLAHVAVGWADATFDMHTNPWDVAAGSLMVRQAGGRYVGYARGVPDEDPASDYTHPGYYAVGGPVDYPTLEGVVQEMSASATRR